MKYLAIICALFAAPVLADDLPDFATCMDTEMAKFELELERHLDGPDAQSFTIGYVDDVDWCGSVGIVQCDHSGDRIPCQHALAVEQDALKAEVIAWLPAPEAVQGQAGEWSDELYPAVWALAQGSSAGPDCAGMGDLMAAWCEAREANRRLGSAVLAHKLARFMGAAPTGIEAGWAHVPPPVRPRMRGDAKK